jgi:hypothetical protein
MPKTSAAIIYGNHIEGIPPIYDLAENIKMALLNTDLISDVSYRKSFQKDELNIIIEEFSSVKFCSQLIKFKSKNPNTKFILVITEIPVNNSYNNFNNTFIPKNNLVENDEFFDIKKYYLNIKIYSYLLKINRIISNYIPKLIKNIIKKISLHELHNSYIDLYFYSRFFNTKILINKSIFNKIYIINESSNDLMKANLGTIFEEFPYHIEIKENYDKKNLIFFSGTQTSEREDIINKIESNGLLIVKNYDFNDHKRESLTKDSFFSLHISRYQSQLEFSSPTRTLQALKYSTILLPFKNYMQASFEEEFGLISFDKLSKINRNEISANLKEYYYQIISKINNVKDDINFKNKNRLKKIISEYA